MYVVSRILNSIKVSSDLSRLTGLAARQLNSFLSSLCMQEPNGDSLNTVNIVLLETVFSYVNLN